LASLIVFDLQDALEQKIEKSQKYNFWIYFEIFDYFLANKGSNLQNNSLKSFKEIRIHLQTSMFFSKTALTQRPISQKGISNIF
jgi:hypothetical protein